VMDEPTNDLDVETLELLEELLLDFDGTLLLVSHDRDFIDHVVTSTLVFEGGGRVNSYVGGYSDWLAQRPAPGAVAGGSKSRAATPAALAPATAKPKKLSYKDQRELETLPRHIEQLEGEQETVHAALADPAMYRDDPQRAAELNQRLTEIETELGDAYKRWERLEAM